MATMYVVVVANAPDLDLAPYQSLVKQADLVLAADGGALALVRAGVLPNVLLGDLDSVDAATCTALAAQGVEVLAYPREKDETDLELALLLAVARGASTIDVLGALGGRWDHTLANVAMLALPELRGCTVRLVADQQVLFLVRDRAELHGQRGDTISLLPQTAEVHGVSTGGLLYPLDNATLRFEQARGVSNVLLEPPGHVSVRDGTLLVVQHDDGGRLQWNAPQP